jgi:hypothetical protein
MLLLIIDCICSELDKDEKDYGKTLKTLQAFQVCRWFTIYMPRA